MTRIILAAVAAATLSACGIVNADREPLTEAQKSQAVRAALATLGAVNRAGFDPVRLEPATVTAVQTACASISVVAAIRETPLILPEDYLRICEVAGAALSAGRAAPSTSPRPEERPDAED